MSFRTGTQSPLRCVSPHLMGLNYPSRIKGYVHLKKKKKMKRKEKKFSHYSLCFMTMESLVKFCSPHNISSSFKAAQQ